MRFACFSSSRNAVTRNSATRTITRLADRSQRFARMSERASPVQLTPPSSGRGCSPSCVSSFATTGSSPGAAIAKSVKGAVAKKKSEGREVHEREERVLLDGPKVVHRSTEGGEKDQAVQLRPALSAEPAHPAVGGRQRERDQHEESGHADEDVFVLHDLLAHQAPIEEPV